MRTRGCVLLFISLLFLHKGLAQDDFQGIIWQKMALQEKIRQKVHEVLSPILKADSYIVDVEIHSQDTTSKERIPLKGIRFNDHPTLASQDYIIFSKLGLEAPLIGDFFTKENLKADIFKSLQSIKVTVSLDSGLPQRLTRATRNILNSLKFPFGKIRPIFEVTTINLGKAPWTQISTDKEKVLSFVSEFSNLIGMIVGSLILGFIAFLGLVILRSGLTKVKKKSFYELDTSSYLKGQDHSHLHHQHKTDGHFSPQFSQVEEDDERLISSSPSHSQGILKFKSFLASSPTDAILLTKFWINSHDNPLHTKALSALVQELNTDELSQIFEYLNQNERINWKSKLEGPIGPQELSSVSEHIAAQIVDYIMDSKKINDPELENILIGLSPEALTRFIRENSGLSKILVNIISPGHLSKLISHMDADDIKYLLHKSSEYDLEEIKSRLSDLKTTLRHYTRAKQNSALVEKIEELLPLVHPNKERALFVGLAQAGEITALKALSHNYFPSELIPHIPDDLLKMSFNAYPPQNFIALLASFKSTLREKFLDIIHPSGTLSRDNIELELTRFELERELKEYLEQNRDPLLKNFIIVARKVIRSHAEFDSELDVILEVWLKRIVKEGRRLEEGLL